MQTINSLISYSVENDLIVNCYISIIKVNHKVRPIQANNDIYNFIKNNCIAEIYNKALKVWNQLKEYEKRPRKFREI